MFFKETAMRPLSALLITTTLLVTIEAAAQARIFCCDDARGRKVCADFVPPECANRAYEERDGQGRIAKKYNAPLTAEQQVRRTAELAKVDAEKRKALEEQRHSAALLANYANENEIDSARDRALAAIEKNLQQSRSKLDEANKAKKKLEGEKAFYKNKPLPAQTRTLIRDNESELRAQQAAVDAQTKEMEDVRARFAAEKQQYLALTGKKPEAAATGKPAVVPSRVNESATKK
ncbi:hypothetical protein PG1C_00050 [Rugosibacter aromaticivorans]|uniref:DUF4124 domain-containing protein n=2 Tax=Rugosibacter aromaticivorans TaxID=1565605 RepID=A0A0C5J5I5_9PROT|nr:hypothetical protein PG1C_00050 [Rugosibacter aromaticivorans]